MRKKRSLPSDLVQLMRDASPEAHQRRERKHQRDLGKIQQRSDFIGYGILMLMIVAMFLGFLIYLTERTL